MVILDEQKKLDDEQAKAFALQDREDEEDAAGA
jgi:hypothetical protein